MQIHAICILNGSVYNIQIITLGQYSESHFSIQPHNNWNKMFLLSGVLLLGEFYNP